jgi:hypothetical protein
MPCRMPPRMRRVPKVVNSTPPASLPEAATASRDWSTGSTPGTRVSTLDSASLAVLTAAAASGPVPLIVHAPLRRSLLRLRRQPETEERCHRHGRPELRGTPNRHTQPQGKPAERGLHSGRDPLARPYMLEPWTHPSRPPRQAFPQLSLPYSLAAAVDWHRKQLGARYLQEERDSFAAALDRLGLVDAFREMYPKVLRCWKRGGGSAERALHWAFPRTGGSQCRPLAQGRLPCQNGCRAGRRSWLTLIGDTDLMHARTTRAGASTISW